MLLAISINFKYVRHRKDLKFYEIVNTLVKNPNWQGGNNQLLAECVQDLDAGQLCRFWLHGQVVFKLALGKDLTILYVILISFLLI